MVPTIDLTPVIEHAGGRGLYGDALRAASEYLIDWHGGDTNPHGVFVNARRVMMAEVSKSSAAVLLATNKRDYWLTGYDFRHPNGGAGASPSVWASVAYSTEEDAIRATAAHALAHFGSQSESLSSSISEGQRREARKMAALLSALVERPVAPSYPSPDTAPATALA